MAPDDRNLDQLSEDVYHDRRITGSVYCDRCGYNLHSLPYVYRCPECGNHYNARPLKCEGVFHGQVNPAPLLEVVLSAVSTAVSVLLLLSAFARNDLVRFVIGWALSLVSLWLILRTTNRWHRFLRIRSLSRRITQHED